MLIQLYYPAFSTSSGHSSCRTTFSAFPSSCSNVSLHHRSEDLQHLSFHAQPGEFSNHMDYEDIEEEELDIPRQPRPSLLPALADFSSDND